MPVIMPACNENEIVNSGIKNESKYPTISQAGTENAIVNANVFKNFSSFSLMFLMDTESL